jgi:hypothetical protein
MYAELGPYRVVIEHFGVDAQAIDGQIQRFTTAEAAAAPGRSTGKTAGRHPPVV